MKLNADILYQSLAEHFEVICCGKEIYSLTLEPPLFFREGMEYRTGMICVGRAGELPEPQKVSGCLLICVGGRMPASWNPRCCRLFSIPSETNLLLVFNVLQDTFAKYENWRDDLRRILDKTADIGEMIRITAPLLNDSIAFCNKHLEIVAQANPDGGNSSMIGTVLSADRAKSFSDTHARNIAMREPFIYHSDGSDVYCINIYKQDSYQGLLTLASADSPHTPGQLELFKFFFQYASAAVGKQAESGKSSLVTLKTVFRDLLGCMPVSDSRLLKALSTVPRERSSWVCLAARPSGIMESLPAEYLCEQVETSFPGSLALHSEPYAAVLIPVRPLGVLMGGLPENLEQTVEKLFCHAGVSGRFTNMRKARFYFRQAVAALETADSMERKEVLYLFSDYALYYGLNNSVGEFPLEYMMPEGLLQLRNEEGQSEYDGWKTLKVYLDNEMNGTQTARDLFIHRTTLQNRLRRIEQLADLTTAEKRMYIRYCMYLYEMHEEMQK